MKQTFIEINISAPEQSIQDRLNLMKSEFLNNKLNNQQTNNELIERLKVLIRQLRNERGLNPKDRFYKHDCLECLYLGDLFYSNYKKEMSYIGYYDLYYHDRGNRIELIARYGDEQPDYMSATYWRNAPEDEQLEILEHPIFGEIIQRTK